MSMPADRRSLLIVGSGVFGTSTAISFLEEGGWDVRIIDRVCRWRLRAGIGGDLSAHDHVLIVGATFNFARYISQSVEQPAPDAAR